MALGLLRIRVPDVEVVDGPVVAVTGGLLALGLFVKGLGLVPVGRALATASSFRVLKSRHQACSVAIRVAKPSDSSPHQSAMARVLVCSTMLGTSMPWSIRLVVQSRCGSCFFSMPRMQSAMALVVRAGVPVDLPVQVVDGGGEEAAGAAGRIQHHLALVEPGVDSLDHELGDGARGVELAGIAGAAQGR